jgi:hypothetical protein
MANVDLRRENLMELPAKHPTKWSFVHSNVVPSNVTVTYVRGMRKETSIPAGWREIQGSILRPANNPAAWYEAKDRSKPSVSSF